MKNNPRKYKPFRYGSVSDLLGHPNPKHQEVMNFLKVKNSKELIEVAEKSIPLKYLESNGFPIQPKFDCRSVYALLLRSRYDFNKNPPQVNYNQRKAFNWLFDKNWITKVEDVDYFKMLPEALRKFGITLNLLPKTSRGLCGFIEWIDGHPVLCVTDIHQNLALCWITLLTLMILMLKHPGVTFFKEKVFTLKEYEPAEAEADEILANLIFNGSEWIKDVNRLSKEELEEINSEVLTSVANIPKIFAEFWIQRRKCKINYSRRHKISFLENLTKYKPKMEVNGRVKYLNDLKDFFKSQGVKQKEIAELLGISCSQLTRILDGRGPLDFYDLIKIHNYIKEKCTSTKNTKSILKLFDF